MAGERLPARFSLRSQLWFRWTGKCFETATSHMQTVVSHLNRPIKMSKNREFWYFLLQGTLDDKTGVYSNYYAYGTHCGDCLSKAMETAENEGVIKPALIETCRLDDLEGFELPEDAIEMSCGHFYASDFQYLRIKRRRNGIYTTNWNCIRN